MPNIGELSLYDVVGTPGVAADVSHMDSKPKVSAQMHMCTLNTTTMAGISIFTIKLLLAGFAEKAYLQIICIYTGDKPFRARPASSGPVQQPSGDYPCWSASQAWHDSG